MKRQPTQQTTGCIRSPHRHISFLKGQLGVRQMCRCAVSEDVQPLAGKDRECSSRAACHSLSQACLGVAAGTWPVETASPLGAVWVPRNSLSLRHCRNWVLGWVAWTVMDSAPFPNLATEFHVSSYPWQISCVVCPLQKGSSAVGILRKPKTCV